MWRDFCMMLCHLRKYTGGIHWFFIHIHMKQFDKRAVFLHLVKAGVCSQWNDLRIEFTRASLIEQIMQNSWFLSHYSSCGYHFCEWIHETCQIKGIFSVMTLKEDIIRLQSRGLWDPWDFFHNKDWILGQQAACYILYLPLKFLFWDKVNEYQWSESIDVWIGEWFCPSSIF